jgi:hypothetical protein
VSSDSVLNAGCPASAAPSHSTETQILSRKFSEWQVTRWFLLILRNWLNWWNSPETDATNSTSGRLVALGTDWQTDSLLMETDFLIFFLHHVMESVCKCLSV